MFDVMSELNWLAVILATIASFILGAIWFTPLFGKAYDRASGYEAEKGRKFPLIYYVGPFVGSLVTAITIAILIYAFVIPTVQDAILLALIVGVGFAASASFVNAINPQIAKPLLYGAITGGYHVASIVLAAVIIFGMK